MLIRRRLESALSPTQMLRTFRDQPGLVGLIGSWDDACPIVAFDPIRTLEPEEDPFAAVEKTPGGLPDALPDDAPEGVFAAGWIGVWGYPLGARVERLPAAPATPHPVAPFHLSYYDSALRLDGGTWWFEALTTPEGAERAEQRYATVVRALQSEPETPRAYTCADFAMTPDGPGHRRAVQKAIAHIEAGDIFQANICLRLEAAFDGDPLDLFCAGVERLRPDYAAFLRTAGGAVACLSPELFLRRTDRAVLSSPIKGTAPLVEDVAVLAGSGKNRAENIMIVDLMRNDLGRVCRPGSIRASGTARPQQHTGVWHLVSDVTGELRDGMGDAELLRATFPPGSVTGAPKVRALEIINTLESTARAAYTGAIGYAGPLAGLELGVVIRTFEFSANRVWLGVGGGIVADSTPASELRECFVKAAPLLAAVGGRLQPHLEPEHPADAAEQTAAKRTLPGHADGSAPDPAKGLIETLLVTHGRAAEAPQHVDRLADSVRELYGAELDRDTILEQVRRKTPGTGLHRLRLVLRPDAPTQVGVELAAMPAASTAPWHLAPVLVPGGLGRHKWRDRRLLDLLAAADGPAGRDLEPLLVDADGTVLETGRASIFLVTDDGVHTPLADDRILPGVTRAAVLRLLRDAEVPVFERPIALEELGTAEEVFVTNALRGVHPAVAIRAAGGLRARDWAVGRTTRWLAGLLEERRTPGRTPPLRRPRPRQTGARVLLVDNYDSFVYNLAQYVEELGGTATVVRNDEADAEQLVRACAAGEYSHLVVSPGPGTPEEAGISSDLIARIGGTVPTLGVCLGHQCIGAAFGARVVRAPQVVHGKPALVHHDGAGVFAGLDGPLVAGRYHSLVVEDLPDILEVTARTASGVVMGVRHRTYAIEGVQVHPESILTPRGHTLVHNFLAAGPVPPAR